MTPPKLPRPRALLVAGLAASLGLLPACAGPTSSGGRAPSRGAETLPDGATEVQSGGGIAGIRSELVEARLSTAPVDRYGVPAKHPLGPGEDALLAALAGSGMRHDPGLSRVARELARTAPDRFHMPSSLIEGLMVWSGMVEPPPRVAIVEVAAPCGTTPAASGCAEAFRALAGEGTSIASPAGEGWLGVGIAEVEGGLTRMIVVATERTVALEPMPLELAARGTLKIAGRLLAGRQDPRVEVVDPDGAWRRIDVRGGNGKGARFSAEVPCRGEGGHRVEVLASGPHGPEVAANFSIYCGVQAPRTIVTRIETVEPGVDVAAIERSSFAALNHARTQRGLPALRWDNAAAAIARAHSQDMVDHDFLGHRSPTTGEAGDRFKKAGFVTRTLRENVGRGYGPETIHEALMNSPGHRINILADDVVAVGIGAVIGPPESEAAGAPRPIFITQNFFAPPEAAPDDPVADLHAKVDRRRAGASLPRLAWDPSLDPMAQGLADGIASGDADAARRRLDAQFQASAYAAISTQQITANDYGALADLDLWGERAPADGLGIGVATISAGERKGSIVLIVILASKTAPKGK